MARLTGATFRGIPLPPINIPESVPPSERQAYAQAFIQHTMREDPEFMTRRIESLGLTPQEAYRMSDGFYGQRFTDEQIAEAESAGFFKKLGKGVQRGAQSLYNGTRQVLSSPWLARAAAAQMDTTLFARPQAFNLDEAVIEGLRARQQRIGAQEAAQREVYAVYDEQPGVINTIGIEDIGELVPAAAAMIAAPGKGVVANVLAGTVITGLEGRTDEESRAEAMAMAAIFGLGTAGGGALAARGVAIPAEFTGRFLLGFAGTVAGTRGMGRATNIIAKLGGIARRKQVDVAIAQEAREVMEQAATRLRPIIQGMNARQLKDMARANFREEVSSWYQDALIPEAGRAGALNVSAFLRRLDIYKDSTIRNRLGGRYGRELAEWRNAFTELAPKLERISDSPALQALAGVRQESGPTTIRLLNGLADFIGGGTWDAIRRMTNPTKRQKALEDAFAKMTVTALLGPGQRVAGELQDEIRARIQTVLQEEASDEEVGTEE